MKYVYIDESGDFGFSKKSSKTVIVAATFTEKQKNLSIWLKRIKRRKLIARKAKKSELKASAQSESFLDYFYRHANSDIEFSVYAVVIDKGRISPKFKNEEGLVYLKAIEQLISISKPDITNNMAWYFDRRTLKKINWRLLQAEIRAKLILSIDNKKPNIEVHPVDSQRVVNIQFADFIAYAMFRSKEFDDNRWISQIRSHIVKITELKIK